MAEKKKKKDHSKFWEIFNLGLWGLIWLFGAVLGILGIIARNVGRLTGQNPNSIYVAETNFSNWCKSTFNWSISRVDFRVLGVILIAIGLIGLLITFYYYSNKIEKKQLVESRKKERLKEIMAQEGLASSSTIAAPKEEEKTPITK